MELTFNLHPAQRQIFDSAARFKLCAAGRRFGKSYLSAVELLVAGLNPDHPDQEVWYVAPTFPEARDIMWRLLLRLGEPVIVNQAEHRGMLTLANGRHIHIKGADRPDTLRGVGLSYVVMDEFATMKPAVWEEIVRPALADVKGEALFIGTPKGKNHYYNLYLQALTDPDWECFTFTSRDNPFLSNDEVEAARRNMSQQIFRQEFEASFQAGGAAIFSESHVVERTEPVEGQVYFAIDPAGYADVQQARGSALAKLDETAIAIVKVGTYGWHVLDIVTGRWGVRETSLRILRECQKHHPVAIGIEKGALKNALMPYLTDQMRRLNIFPNVMEVSHGGKAKYDRIVWALQGRFQNQRITCQPGDWVKKFVDQLLDFPNRMAHDDMLDALSYIDQVATIIYHDQLVQDTWEPVDNTVGF